MGSAGPAAVIGGLIALGGGVDMKRHIRAGGVRNIFLATVVDGSLLVAGLILLDGEQGPEVVFTEVTEGMKATEVFSADDIATYNDELDRLNAINQTITVEFSANEHLNATQRWAELSPYLSPATLKVAAFNGEILLNALAE